MRAIRSVRIILGDSWPSIGAHLVDESGTLTTVPGFGLRTNAILDRRGFLEIGFVEKPAGVAHSDRGVRRRL